MEMAITGDGNTLYVAAFGSSKIGVLDTQELEDNTFVPDAATHIEVSGGGPSGLLLDELRNQLYVTTRFNNAVVVIDTVTGAEKRSGGTDIAIHFEIKGYRTIWSEDIRINVWIVKVTFI